MTSTPVSGLSSTDRRRLLALTGAFLAGAAGCMSAEDPDGDSNDTDGSNGTDENGDDGDDEDEDGFDVHEPPEFPQLDFVTDPDVDDELLAEQVRGNVEFALDLLAELREKEPDGNLFFSPYSVSVALAMTYAGARGETAEEMAEALRYELENEDLHPAFGALEAEFVRRNEDGQDVEDPTGEDADGPAFEFNTANATWGQEDLEFEEAFLDLLEAYYEAGMRLVDYAGDPEGAREEINEWVAEQTNDLIEELLPEGSISESTRLVLTNAIYFYAMWKYPFDEGDTESGTFTALGGEESEVQMMHQSIEVPYAEIDGHQLVELPYANDDSSMVIVLPAEGEFEAFEEAFSVDRLATMLAETATPEVDLTMPKFEIETQFSLVEAMGALGMEQAFGPGADFSGMTGDAGLFIDDILHEAVVDVDELGTEAAAATAVIMDESAPMDHAEVVVDRPFLFYVRDRPTETPLFFGRVVDGETLQEG